MSPVAVEGVYASEHYWPGLAVELVLAQAQRLARVEGWRGTVVVPSQQTTFGLFLASGTADVRAAISEVALHAATVSPAWWLQPDAERPEQWTWWV